MRKRTTLFLSAAIGWLVAGLLYQQSPCKAEASLLSADCLPESIEVLVVFLLLASVPWFTLRSGTRLFALARSGQATRLRAFGRFALTSLVTVGAVFIAGSALVLLAQAFRWGFFSGEAGLRSIIVALLASAWALGGMAFMAILLAMRGAPKCTGADTRTPPEAAPAKDLTD